MKKHDKEVLQSRLDAEEKELKRLKAIYNKAADDIMKKIEISNGKISVLLANWDDLTDEEKSIYQSQIYQRNFQKSLKTQIDGFLKDLNSKQYATMTEYMEDCYKNGYLGAMYSIHKQGIPIISPIDQKKVTKAMFTDSKISKKLYTKLGEDVEVLKKRIANNLSRGIATASDYKVIARNIAADSNVGFNRAMRITRTEGNRISNESAYDASMSAKDKGADVVKSWDAALDKRTRESHRRVDGEIRELDEKFSNGMMYPSDSAGGAAEVVNCRCALLQRARWALDDDELETLKERAKYYGLDKTKNFDDFKAKYLKAAEAEVKQAGEVTTIEELQKYAASKMDKWGVSVDVSGTGKYLEEVKENIDLIDGLMAEYNSTMVDLQFKGGFDRKSGGTYMLNGKSSMFVRLQGSSSMADTLKVGKNKKFKTATHEFAHTLSQSDEKIDAEFWKEIKSVKNKYNRALTKIDKSELVEHTMTASEAAAAKSKIFISDYGNTTVDEFLAEAFAQARLAESPSPFSVEVLNIVDKYFKKSAAKKAQKVVEKVKKPAFIPAKTTEEAKNYAEKTLGLFRADYDKMPLDFANMINKEVTRVYDIFGNLNAKGRLEAIIIWPKKVSWYAAYSSNSKLIGLKNVTSKGVMKKWAKNAAEQYAAGFWSTNNAEHAIRHELGHAVQHIVADDDLGKINRIQLLHKRLMRELDIDSWSANKTDADKLKQAGEHISYYALRNENELIAESVAEYMSGNPRPVAKKVIEILTSDNMDFDLDEIMKEIL